MYVCFFVGGHLVQSLPFVYAFLFGKLIIIIIIIIRRRRRRRNDDNIVYVYRIVNKRT